MNLLTHPDWNVSAMYRAVLEEPERIELRLGLADLLEQTCDTDEQSERAELIRVQCELATMEQPRELHGHDKYPGKALTLVPHGPNYWTTTLCGEYKVGDRIDAIANILFAQPKRRFHGLVISKILNFSEGEVVLKRDALSKPFPQKRYDALRRREAELLTTTHREPLENTSAGIYKLVPVSNVVRWSGKLGGELATSFCNYVDDSGFDVFWLIEPGSEDVASKFWCGFPSIVSCTVAAWMGERPDSLDAMRASVIASSTISGSTMHGQNLDLMDLASINACGPELVAMHPITRVECPGVIRGRDGDWSIFRTGGDGSTTTKNDDVPDSIFQLLKGGTKYFRDSFAGTHCVYSKQDDAQADLSAGLIRWARQRQPKELSDESKSKGHCLR